MRSTTQSVFAQRPLRRNVRCRCSYRTVQHPLHAKAVRELAVEGAPRLHAERRGDHAMDAKDNFEFERQIPLCRSDSVLDLRHKK
jgi:hypothetical protein